MAVTVGVIPKSTRNPYFEDCRRGAQEAAQELGFTLRWDGPPQVDAGRQAQIVEAWARDSVPVIAVSVESSARLVAAMKAARTAGTKVLTWDSDGPPDTRDFTIVHATPAAVAHALSFEIGRILAGKGEFAAITSTLSAPNQSAWITEFKARVANEYPDLRLIDVQPCDDDVEKAKQEAQRLLATHPDLKAIVGFCSPAVPGAAQALKEARRADVRLTGVSLPAICRTYIEEGIVQSVVMWKTRNLGYLVGASAQALATGALQRGAVSFRAGRLGSVAVHGDEIRLGRCHIVTRGNLADFD
jgi:ABC-type sugar transport system substrate-binding protein